MKQSPSQKLKKAVEGCSKEFANFFDWSLEYLIEHNKCIKMVNARHVNMGPSQKCSGWCDGSEIVIARKNPLFEQVYVHEFSHMNQAIEESPLWGDDSDFWNLLYTKGLSIPDYQKVMEVIALERDCEKRAIAHSKKWKLFDNEAYAKQANTYLHYYQYIFLTKKWVNSTSIYHPMILDVMSSKIKDIGSFYEIDMDLMNLFHQCLEPKGKYYKKGFSS
jgi:hypothetical protein